MPDKPATVAAYAAGASLAAIALCYVFGPNFTLDGDESNSSARKKAIVGLSNPANDCFINSVLQALAGLGELRVYLIRELHRREIEGPEVYESPPRPEDVPRGDTPEKVWQLQQAPVTRALKEMLDRLNERPIYKKTISARPFILALEAAFRTRISRNQQDAHEFLQVVVERLCDEFHAGAKARARSSALLTVPHRGGLEPMKGLGQLHEKSELDSANVTVPVDDESNSETSSVMNRKTKDDEYSFPLEGKLESQVECQFCQYKYKPNMTPFVILTLQVPQKNSTTLSSCFDGLLKTEYIEDFRCDKCQLQFMLEQNQKAARRARSESELQHLNRQISLIQKALETDPEDPPQDIIMPDPKTIPRRKIARHMRITVFPKIIAIHLSRSIFDRSSSTKNAAKVSFPERLPLGGILDQRWYRLLGIVCHKGSHHSGHYESFRRNHVYAPFSTPDVFRSYAQSRAPSENPSTMPSPKINPKQKSSTDLADDGPSSVTPELNPSVSSSPSISSTSLPRVSLPLSNSNPLPTPSPTSSPSPSSKLQPTDSSPSTVSPEPSLHDSSLPVPPSTSTVASSPAIKPSVADNSKFRRKKRHVERWWRISDDKVKECKTSDVLSMQKEVYLLFYELERPGDHS
ncbi:hypothetical protein VTO42DRAFT_1993 [Malbranchea cinnamomea]